MLDDTALKDRTPFDVNTIEKEVSALVDQRTGVIPKLTLRRPLDRRNLPPVEPTPANPPELALPPTEEGATQAGPDRSIESILAERGKTHGDFTDNARVTQSLKRIVHSEAGWDRLTDVQREALHMILHKVGRIISGNPDIHDHWDDIAGYAKLASERIEP